MVLVLGDYRREYKSYSRFEEWYQMFVIGDQKGREWLE